ncbi:MAG: ATP-binding protein [Pseudomonadota bacterium]
MTRLATISKVIPVDGKSSAHLLAANERADVQRIDIESPASPVQSASYLQDFIETGTAGFWDWDLEHDEVLMSRRLKSTFGFADDELPNNRSAWQRLVHSDDRSLDHEAFAAHVASPATEPYDVVLRHWHKDGSMVWIRRVGRIIEWTVRGEPRRAQGIHIDVTVDMQRMEAQARQQEEIRRFAFSTAHDLIQPVNTIQHSLAAIMVSPAITEDLELEPYVSFVESATQRLKTRIHSIIEYSRLQDREVESVPVALTEIASIVVDDVGPMLSASGASVDVGALGTVDGVPELIERVFLNLIENAVKYRRLDRPCRIAVESAHARPGMMAVTVSDNGIGIEPQHREKVLRLFTRLHTETQYPGSGLGLALCQQIVQRLRGDIFIHDGIDGGTGVTFSLPASGRDA